MGLFTLGVIIRGAKKTTIFFPSCMSIFLPHSTMKRLNQSDLSLDHVHGAAAVAQKDEECLCCFENQSKQTLKKIILNDSEREESGLEKLYCLLRVFHQDKSLLV